MLRSYPAWQPLGNNFRNGGFLAFLTVLTRASAYHVMLLPTQHLTYKNVADSKEKLDFILKTRGRVGKEVEKWSEMPTWGKI